MDLNQEVIEALINLQVEPKKAIISGIQKSLVINTFRGKFIRGNPSQYWLSFSMPFISLEYEDVEDVDKIVISSFGDSRIIYLLTENDFLLQISSNYVVKLLAECSFFEYYLFDENYTQMLCENDHNELLYINTNTIIFQEGS